MRPPRAPTLRPALLAAAALLLLGRAPAGAAEPPDAGRDLAARVRDALPEGARADLAFLLHLGWQVVTDPAAAQPRAEPGGPCARESLEAARAAGDLRIVLPPGPPGGQAARLAALLPGLVDSQASRCAWQHRVHAAVKAATDRLTANTERGNYVFPPFLLLWDSPFWDLEPPTPEWVERGDLFVASGSPARAVGAFYEKEAQAECYGAQLLLTYAVQLELYGPEAFDRAFLPEEIVLGAPEAYLKSPIGQHAVWERAYRWRALLIPAEQQDQDPGAVLGALGPRAFSGVTGIVRDVQGGTLSNENFTIVSVTPAAAEAFRTGGFSRLTALSREALEMEDRARGFLASGATVLASERRLEEVFRDPLLAEVRVYVHPYGVIPFAQIFRDKLRKRRAVVEAMPYVNGREDAFYARYRAAFARGLLDGAAPPAPSGPPAAATAPAPGAGGRPEIPPPPPPPPWPPGR